MSDMGTRTCTDICVCLCLRALTLAGSELEQDTFQAAADSPDLINSLPTKIEAAATVALSGAEKAASAAAVAAKAAASSLSARLIDDQSANVRDDKCGEPEDGTEGGRDDESTGTPRSGEDPAGANQGGSARCGGGWPVGLQWPAIGLEGK